MYNFEQRSLRTCHTRSPTNTPPPPSQAWAKTGCPLHIFRLPGIYGPTRGPLAKAKTDPDRRLIFKENQVFCRIHVDDIVECVMASIRNPNPGRIYNVTDDEPAPSHVVNEYVYTLLGQPVPPIVKYTDVEHELSPMLKSFYGECKRVSNKRIKQELGVVLKYPTYREGFVAQKKEEEDIQARGESTASTEKRPAKDGKAGAATAAAGTSSSLVMRLLQTSKSSGTRVFHSLLAALRRWLLQLQFAYIASRYNCVVYLVDNGSVRPGSTLGMRRLSAKLGARSMGMIHFVPASWRYSDRVDASLLAGEKAQVLASAIETELATKSSWLRPTRAVALPLFLGPSDVVTKELPKAMKALQVKTGDVNVRIADPLVDLMENAMTCRVTRALLNSLPPNAEIDAIVLVDHGSPNPDVTRVRRALASRLRALVYPIRVIDASMERRPGPEYAYNDPLLEHVFNMGGLDRGRVFVTMAFLFPGNHAGPGGDIETILDQVRAKYSALTIKVGSLVMDEQNDESATLSLLEDRYSRALL